MSPAERFFAQLSPSLSKGLDLLWQYREGIGAIVGLILLFMIVDNLVAIHRELERLRLAVEQLAEAPRANSEGDLAVDSREWRAD